MPKTTHDLTTASTLRAALAGVPDDALVVVMRGGVLVPCEVVVTTCGDWVVVNVCEVEREDALTQS